MSAEKNTVVAVVAGNTILPIAGLNDEARELAEGQIEFTLATTWQSDLSLNVERLEAILQAYGHRVEPELRYTMDHKKAQERFAIHISSHNTSAKKTQFDRLDANHVRAVFRDLGEERAYTFRQGPRGAPPPPVVGGDVMSAEELLEKSRGLFMS